MNQGRFASKLNNLTKMERKVFDAVPISDTWDSTKIYSELKRQGTTLSIDQINGLLLTLKEQKLIRATSNRQYSRELEVPAPRAAARLISEKDAKPKQPDATPASPLELLYLHAEGMRKTLDDLSSLVSGFESAILQIEELLASKDDRQKKLEQFSSLAAELGLLQGKGND
ncbi:MAG: hypothetical protein MJA28_06335 [Gammaproteobacteria bacterium]|nr:hypothetical protein [Gammaproteobacteria bacterium]